MSASEQRLLGRMNKGTRDVIRMGIVMIDYYYHYFICFVYLFISFYRYYLFYFIIIIFFGGDEDIIRKYVFRLPHFLLLSSVSSFYFLPK